MRNKKGFTLVELLAVIVVLAVVSIIAVPLIINMIENARKGALKDSAFGLMEAADMYYTRHMELSNSEDGYIDFSILNGKQTSDEKLDYKGKIQNGYLRLTNNKEMALCIDDNKYYAVKNIDGEDVLVDEGICSGEYDEDLLGYVTIGGSSFVGVRLNVKAYVSKDSMPSKANPGYIAIITDKKVADYFVSPSEPTTKKEGTVWVVQSSDADNYIETKTGRLGLSYALQYEDSKWVLKETYIYNEKWIQLKNYTQQWDFDYTGEYEEFEAPYSGYYEVQLWGAAGATYGNIGGAGAYTSGEIYLKENELIYIYVGGKGMENSPGWNGGGGGKSTGGGATDVRTVPTSTKNVWNEQISLKSRIMVAAGGGGGGKVSGAIGGSGGGLVASSTVNAGRGIATGGTQLAGGTGAVKISNGKNGSFGMGGDGIAASGGYTGGGGGGWYGGGSGAVDGSGDDDGSGAGGSSYISGHAGVVSITTELGYKNINMRISNTGKYFINTIMIDGEGYNWTNYKQEYVGMPTIDEKTTIQGNTEAGHAKIKFLGFTTLTDKQYLAQGEKLETNSTFVYTGFYQTYTVSKTGKYKIELWGSQGTTYGYTGGLGSYTSGEIDLTKGEILYVYVGGQNGWNGGGSGSSPSKGGGATDIRTTSTPTLTNWNEQQSLKSRIMVAAGGGGGGKVSGAVGGPGGGLVASSTVNVGRGVATGGTQTSGGTGAVKSSNGKNGLFGMGGDGIASAGGYTGGGGGGWYGGGSGAVDGSGDDDGSGAGGSSYISGHQGCVGIKSDGSHNNANSPTLEDSYSYTGFIFTNTKMIDGGGYKWTTAQSSNDKMPSQDGKIMIVGNEGNGYAKITYISAS